MARALAITGYRPEESPGSAVVAEQIGARNGTVLKGRFSGGKGLNGPLTLGIITLRDGSAVEVAQRFRITAKSPPDRPACR